MEILYWFGLIKICRLLVWLGLNRQAHWLFESSGLHAHLVALMRRDYCQLYL